MALSIQLVIDSPRRPHETSACKGSEIQTGRSFESFIRFLRFRSAPRVPALGSN